MSTNDHFYLIHLDEETLITSEAMQNCLKFCLANKFRCGHGMITCGWHKIASPLATFVDSWTVSLYAGMMYTSYRLCHRAHIIKGGFFLLRNDLEAEINWDFGPQFTAEDFRLGRLLNSTKEPVEVVFYLLNPEFSRSRLVKFLAKTSLVNNQINHTNIINEWHGNIQ